MQSELLFHNEMRSEDNNLNAFPQCTHVQDLHGSPTSVRDFQMVLTDNVHLDKTMVMYILICLTLSNIQMISDASEADDFRKHCGKRTRNRQTRLHKTGITIRESMRCNSYD